MPDNFAIVAEQDWNLRNVLRQHLDGVGYRTLVTPLADEAEDFARRIEARIVLLDVELPGISAFEACARIRRLPGYERVPILMMTGAATHRRQLAAERAGANEMLLKPFSMSHLSREIARLLGEPAPVEAGEATVKVWKSPPSLAWKFGEGSELSAGRRMLETLRPGGGRGI